MRELATVFLCILCVDARFILSNTDQPHRSSSYSTFDCLYFHSVDYSTGIADYWVRRYHLVPYCRRPDGENWKKSLTSFEGGQVSFDDLYKKGVTSSDLLTWFAPFDVAERYENNRGTILNESFYNCSTPLFGSRCQYYFENSHAKSFQEIVRNFFDKKPDGCFDTDNSPCYPFLKTCDLGFSHACLDWRQICDGRHDCLDGEDERFCDLLESNQCAPDEHRCHYGGQCVPLTFVRDGKPNFDCLDGSDEIEFVIYLSLHVGTLGCRKNPLFECEERICRFRYDVSCGDGECIQPSSSPHNTFRCSNHRSEKVTRMMLDTSTECQQTLLCLLGLSPLWTKPCSLPFFNHYPIARCHPLASQCYSEWVTLSQKAILFGFFQLIYFTNRTINEFRLNVLPDFVCFDEQRCPGLLHIAVVTNLNNGLTCFHQSDLPDEIGKKMIKNFFEIEPLFQVFIRRCLTMGSNESCSDASLFHCPQSKRCIAKHRLVDSVQDCFFGEDETYPACSLNDSSRFVCLSDPAKCLSFVALVNFARHCRNEQLDIIESSVWPVNSKVIYYKFCDHSRDGPIIDSLSLDELYCEHWPCNTPYTRCDNTWDCHNGVDEMGCTGSSCLPDEHSCLVYGDGYYIICLPFVHLYDRFMDGCIYNRTYFIRQVYFDNRTDVNIIESFSWHANHCITPEKLCRLNSTRSIDSDADKFCLNNNFLHFKRITMVQTYDGKNLCRITGSSPLNFQKMFFSKSHLGSFPKTSQILSNETIDQSNSQLSQQQIIGNKSDFYCHRGIFVRSSSKEKVTCLCPPSLFGDRCQWQSQRVSLTIQFVFLSAQTVIRVFQAVFMLIDDKGRIAPNVEQLTFVPSRDCGTKYNMYLLYPDRPKNPWKNYSVRVDMLDLLTLEYYTSWHLSIPFVFLPVNRLSDRLIIPEHAEVEDCPLVCSHHGHCRRYANKRTTFFCQCNQGYSGLTCNETYQCSCASGARCHAGIPCICPLHRFGRHCLLEHTICQKNSSPCENQGLCVPADTRLSLHEFTCLCRKGNTGQKCQHVSNLIRIKFPQHFLATTSMIALHLITAFDNRKHERMTLLKHIPVNDDKISVHITNPFHIAIIEIFNRSYYRAIVREIFIPSEEILTQVELNQRCPPINELGNMSWVESPLWYRGKFYPLLCQKNKSLMCFYDNIHICMCDLDRFANCFEFNHSMTYDCRNWNPCENGGQCLMNNGSCPTTTLCICPECFYGTKCQFSTRGFDVSLDPILGRHIKPHVDFYRQSPFVKVAVTISSIILFIGTLSCSLSIMTFRMKELREFGCGWYFLVASIASLNTILLLGVKVCYLILSHMALIHSRNVLYMLCLVTDPTLRALLASNDWLSACVAIERLAIVHQGIVFNRAKSRSIAKRVIPVVLCITFATHFHDFVYRRLIDDFDADEQRTWCFTRYSPFLDWFNSAIMFFHFLVPALINLLAIFCTILSAARSRAKAQQSIPFKNHILHEISRQRHVIVTPVLIVLLSFPRIIIPFFVRCMKTPRNPTLYIIGYFISYAPPILTFFLFVLPSDTYRDACRKALRLAIRRFHCAQ